MKIKVVYYNEKNEVAVESLWAERCGANFKLKNIPFFASNLAYNDLVKVEEDGGEFFFDELLEASGHSTIQIVFFKKDVVQEVTKRLLEMGASWEGAHIETYIAVDVPPSADYTVIKKFLSQQESDLILSYKESCKPYDSISSENLD